MSREKNERVSSQVMELKDLIAGPLVATIDADSLSAQRYLDYLFKIAFETYDPKTGKTGRLRMLTFNYRSRDLSGAAHPICQHTAVDFGPTAAVADTGSRFRLRHTGARRLQQTAAIFILLRYGPERESTGRPRR